MFGLTILDIAVIIVYFAVMIGIGLWSMRRINNQEDYFLGGRTFGKIIQTFASFGQSTTADNSVGAVTTTFTNGIAGIWSSLLYLPSTPVYWMISPWMRRLRLLTLGDFFEERYGSKRMAATYAVLGSIVVMAYLSVGFSAMSKTVLALTPKSFEQLTTEEHAEYRLADELDSLRQADYVSLDDTQKNRMKELQLIKPRKVFSHINESMLIWIVCLIVLVYTVTGGLMAAFISDTVQGVFIIILTFLLIPFAWAKINLIYGGDSFYDALTTIHAQLPEAYFDIFGSPSAIDFTWFYIVSIGIMSALNTPVQPNALVAIGSAKDEYTARFGFVTGLFMKRFCTVFWGILALAAIVLYHESVHDPDLVWGYATLDLLGPLKLGLVGLMISCLTAALMSTADCMMVTASSLLTHNLYRPLVSGKSEEHYLKMGRILGAVVVIGGAVIATQFDSILQMLKFIWEFNVILAASFWLGMKWRRATRISAWYSIIVTMVLFFILPILLPVSIPWIRTDSDMLKMTNPAPMVRSYTVREMDVAEREKAIETWDRLSVSALAEGARPEQLTAGQVFERTYVLERKSIFWTKGISRTENGSLIGRGNLNTELVLLDKLGFKLVDNSHALNQTIRIVIRTVLPFLVLIAAALLTKPDDKKMLDRFFVKMKTVVIRDRAADNEEMEKSYASPGRFDHLKLFPGSNWEFDKWDKVDSIGFTVSVLVALGIVGILVLMISIGG
ncbi:sodium:solute symporter [Candidatus Latescibacterota bacterium]